MEIKAAVSAVTDSLINGLTSDGGKILLMEKTLSTLTTDVTELKSSVGELKGLLEALPSLQSIQKSPGHI